MKEQNFEEDFFESLNWQTTRKKKHNYRFKAQEVCFLNFPLYVFKAEVANFTSIDIKILKIKFFKEIKKLYRLVKRDC